MPSSVGGTWLVRLGLTADSFGALCTHKAARVRRFNELLRGFEALVLTIV